jgi:replicative DNA helicase
VNDLTPPNDINAEQAVLGGMLISKDVISDVLEILEQTDFYRPIHGTIFDAISALFSMGEPSDPVTVANYLDNHGDLMRVGGVPYMHTLTEAVPTAANATYYARIVSDKAALRRLGELGMMFSKLSTEPNGRETTDIIDLAQQAALDLTVRRRGDEYSSFADAVQPTLDEIEAAGKTGDEVVGVPTGFLDLDRLLGGLMPGQLIIVAGRPGLGKSTASMDFARHAAIRSGQASAIFSLEMSKSEMIMRLLSAECKIPLGLLRSGNLEDNHWSRMARRLGEIGDAPIFLDDSATLNLMEIRAKARKLKQRHNLKLLVVDYLQLMSSPKASQNRQQEVSDMSRGLKLLAKEIECPVIAVSQLNRGPEQRNDKRPQLSDLRESGSLEQDADVVILLHRDDYYDKESPRAGEADFIVAKHRNGPTDTVTVAAQLHLSRFVDMAIA